jgi:hypothetical protein
MTRRRHVAITLALILLAAAVPTADNSVPFKATIETQPVVTGFCGPTCLQLHISGSGVATQLGRMTIEGDSQVDLAAFRQTGTITMAAANGDTLEIEIDGSVIFSSPNPTDPVTFSGGWTVTSGTGRFANSNGGGSYHGSAAGPSGSLFMDGSLSGIGRGR